MPNLIKILKLTIISSIVVLITHMALRQLQNRLATISKTSNSKLSGAVGSLTDTASNNKLNTMSAPGDYTTVSYVTAPNETVAQTLATGLVERKLAACVNMVKGISSIYQWQGKIEQEIETLLIIKSQSNKSRELINYVQSNHPYDCPEVVTLKVDSGSEPYLNWIRETVNKKAS